MRFRTTYIESVLYEGDSIDDAVAAARKGVVGWRARGGLISVQFSRSVKRDACYDVDMDTDGRHFVCAGEIDWDDDDEVADYKEKIANEA